MSCSTRFQIGSYFEEFNWLKTNRNLNFTLHFSAFYFLPSCGIGLFLNLDYYLRSEPFAQTFHACIFEDISNDSIFTVTLRDLVRAFLIKLEIPRDSLLFASSYSFPAFSGVPPFHHLKKGENYHFLSLLLKEES